MNTENQQRENATSFEYWNSLSLHERGVNAPLIQSRNRRFEKNNNIEKTEILTQKELGNILENTSSTDFLSFCTIKGIGNHAPYKEYISKIPNIEPNNLFNVN